MTKNKPKHLLKYLQIPTYLYSHTDTMGMDKQTDGQTEMGKTQGFKKIGYYLKNKLKNLLKY
jgi:hypothetical protein